MSQIQFVPLGVINGLSGGTAEVPEKVLFFMKDGHVHDLEPKLLGKPFTDVDGKALQKEKKVLFTLKEEASVKATKGSVQGTHTVQCVEFTYLVTKNTLNIPEKPRLHFSSMTTRSDYVGPFVIPRRDDPSVLQVRHQDKHKLYGAALVLAGGAVAGDTGDVRAPKPQDMVPMSWHSNSIKEFEELSHSYNIVGWIDAAPSEILAFHCVQTKRPYLGFAHTKLHKDVLETFLAERVFTAMQTSGDALYEPDLKAIIDKDKPGAADNVNADGSTPATAKKKATKKKP